jgi:hypothetical protein
MGTDIDAGDLARLLAAPADALDEPLQRAISSGLVRRDPGGTVGFSHDLFREGGRDLSGQVRSSWRTVRGMASPQPSPVERMAVSPGRTSQGGVRG